MTQSVVLLNFLVINVICKSALSAVLSGFVVAEKDRGRIESYCDDCDRNSNCRGSGSSAGGGGGGGSGLITRGWEKKPGPTNPKSI
jgi:hypothetical protein